MPGIPMFSHSRMLVANTCPSMVCAIDTSTGEVSFLSDMTAVSNFPLVRIRKVSTSILMLMLGDLEGLNSRPVLTLWLRICFGLAVRNE
jgi:hypothetical protein